MLITIRPAAPSEADVLTGLALAGKRHWGYPESWLEAWRGLLTITPDDLTAHVVSCAEDETGKVIGFYAMERNGDHCRLEHLWLDPSLIGRGLGLQLFEHAVRSARAMGAAELLIEAEPNAEGFYLHMGAVRVGETVSRLTGTVRVLPQLRYPLPGTAEQERARPRASTATAPPQVPAAAIAHELIHMYYI
jgi:GNAT superfamily N-acetyltransferase